MKLIIAGSRHFDSDTMINTVLSALSLFKLIGVAEVVSGMSGGVDVAGIHYAKISEKKISTFPADWKLGKSAGPRRNRDMAMYADALLLIWDGESPGSKNMKSEMERLHKPIYEVVFKAPPQ